MDGKRDRSRIIARLGSSVFANLGTAYLIAVSLSQSPWTLTNSVVSCIVCLYTAYKFEEYLEYE
jgi:hypothetical protein